MKKKAALGSLVVVAVFLSTILTAGAAQPAYGTANVDGNPGEWDLSNGDFFANMHRASDPDKKVESKLYLRYDCSAGTMYALVYTVDDIPALAEPENAWIAINGVNNKVVTGNSGDDGTPPDFQWVGLGFDGDTDHARGWEGSFSLAEGNYKIIAHVNVFDDGEPQTSGTDTKTDKDGIDLEIQCPALSVEKTASSDWTRQIEWSIAKSVTPDTWHLFQGDSGTSQYTVSVEKSSTDTAYVSGEICVTNDGGAPTQGLQIVDQVELDGQVVASVNVDVSGHPVLQGGEEHCYSYQVPIQEEHIQGSATYKDTASATITNGSGSSGTAETTLAASPGIIGYETITVNDNGESWSFSDSGSETYEGTFTEEGTHHNTATIDETGQSAEADVVVNVYDLHVSKDASTALDRMYHWTINKSADISEITLPTGQTVDVNYSVVVGLAEPPYTDSGWAVSGDISVHNPAPIPATINGVSDLISPDVGVDVDCDGATFPYTLGADQTLECSYSASLPDGSERTNTATATLQNHAYHYQMDPTETGTTDFSGQAAVDFGNATVNQIDECVEVWDTNVVGILGTLCASDVLPHTFTYGRTFGPFEEPGTYEFPNTASFVTNDTGTEVGSDWIVEITVPEEDGVTSLEVWKTAEALWARSYDWSITKSVEPEELELAQDESGDVTYTIEVVRSEAGDTYTVQGTIWAENDPEHAALLVDVKDCIEYKDPDNPGPEPGDFTTLQCQTLQVGGTIDPGATATWDYSIEFTPVEGANAYRNRAEVTISNHPDGIHTFLYRESFDLPSEPNSEEDECATVTDVQDIPEGFSATDDYPDGGWYTCQSDTFTIEKTVTNDSAETGTYYLDNTATVTEEDTGQTDDDDARVTITVPEGTTVLKVWKTLEALWVRSYDWTITKSAEPEELELDQDESGDVTYTIEVVRSEPDDTYTVQGTIYAQNGMLNEAHILLVEDSISYKVGDNPWVELTRVTVADESWIPKGGLAEWAYSVSFEPIEGATYRNTAYVTLVNHPEGEHTYLYHFDFDLPGEPTSEEDECATVTDVQDIPEGFSATDDYPDSGWYTCQSDTFTIEKTVTNNCAETGTYDLDNTATVTEEDSGDETSDDATVTITVPEGVTSLDVGKTAQAFLARSYDWTITKSAEPEELELAQGESGDVTYTIEVERQVAGETYWVEGTISAGNDPEHAALLVDVVDCIEYRHPDNPGPEPGGFTTLKCETLQEGGSIPPGETATWDYSIEFTPVEGANAYRNRAEVTISNHPDGEHTFLYRESFDLPSEPNSEEDACAQVTDVQDIPEGFLATDDYPEGGWYTCQSDTFTIEKTVTNNCAGPGTYDLDNTATVTEEDSGDETSDDATVTITVPEEQGKITIKKDAHNNNSHSFKFIFDGDETFYLKHGQSKTLDNLAAGTYTVAEDKASFPDKYWALFKVTCEGNSVPVEKDLANARATITLKAGEQITCTFHNERVGIEE